jgi:hypothetical protein
MVRSGEGVPREKAWASITLTHLLRVLVQVETKRPRCGSYILRKAIGEIIQP